jgi:hypothetical protein
MAGKTYRYTGKAGLGETHADPDSVPLAHRDAGDGPASSMAELDMPPGTVVELDLDDDPESDSFGATHRDDEHNLEIVNWKDGFGVARRTSIEPGFFAENFEEVGG